MNLNEDATLSECLLYYIKEGVTRIGSPEANIPQDIQLVGAHILSEHCVFENSEGIVKLVPLVSRTQFERLIPSSARRKSPRYQSQKPTNLHFPCKNKGKLTSQTGT